MLRRHSSRFFRGCHRHKLNHYIKKESRGSLFFFVCTANLRFAVHFRSCRRQITDYELRAVAAVLGVDMNTLFDV